MAESYNLRASRETHHTIDKKLAKVNLRRAKKGKKQLSKGAFVGLMADKALIKDYESL